MAVAIAGRMLWARRDVLFSAVVLWALLGISLKRWGAPEAGSELVAGAALVGLVSVGLATVATAVRRARSG